MGGTYDQLVFDRIHSIYGLSFNAGHSHVESKILKCWHG